MSNPFSEYAKATRPTPAAAVAIDRDMVIPDFIAAMEAAGVGPAESIAHELAAGELVRFEVQGDRKGRKNGWAVLHFDGIPAGAFGCNKRGISDKWRANVERPKLSRADRAAFKLKMAQAKAAKQRETDERHLTVADQAEGIWRAAGTVNPSHPYLAAKRIPGEGLRQSGSKLLVPMRDIGGKLWNVQRIFPDKSKLFLKGGRTQELMLIIGDPDAVICIGEGMGTMAAVRRATGHAVVASFSEKNLTPVARLIAERWPDLDLIVCADDDAHLVEHPTIKRNIGLEAAHAAAAAVGGRVAVPPRGKYHA
jgi:putative DNA primase/helicase